MSSPEEEEEEDPVEDSMGKRFEEWMMTDWEFGPYYWETETEASLGRKVRDRTIWTFEKFLRGSEFVGEVVAHIVGMSDSHFQWVIDAADDERQKELEHRREQAQRSQLEGASILFLPFLKELSPGIAAAKARRETDLGDDDGPRDIEDQHVRAQQPDVGRRL